MLPHPHAHERAFVLVPWLDVDPDAVLAGHGPSGRPAGGPLDAGPGGGAAVRPTSWRTLALLALIAGGGGWLLADRAYGSLVALPAYAPATAALIALFELGLAKVVSDQINHRSRRAAGCTRCR